MQIFHGVTKASYARKNHFIGLPDLFVITCYADFFPEKPQRLFDATDIARVIIQNCNHTFPPRAQSSAGGFPPILFNTIS